MKSRLLSIILCITMIICIPVAAFAENESTEDTDGSATDFDSGVYDSVPWRITADNSLIIGSPDNVYTFDYRDERTYSDYPWNSYYSDYIDSISFEGTVYGNGSHAYMFADTEYDYDDNNTITKIDISGFNTENVTDMSCMFKGCSELTSLELDGFDTSRVTNMENMFYGCERLTYLDLSRFSTLKVTDMSGMFSGCSLLPNPNVNGFNTSSVTDMSNMFNNCSSLEELELSLWDMMNVSDASWMFSNCSALTTVILDCSKSNEIDTSGMFNGCQKLVAPEIGTIYPSDTSYMFEDCKSLTSFDMSSIYPSNIKEMKAMFSGCTSLEKIDLNFPYGNTKNVTNMSSMFKDCTALKTIEHDSALTTENVTRMNEMFRNCRSLTQLPMAEAFNTSSLTQANNMFRGCRSIKKLDLSGWDANSLRNTRSMFLGCKELISLDISSFSSLDSKALNGCKSLERIAIGNECSFASDVYTNNSTGWRLYMTLSGAKVKDFYLDELSEYEGGKPGWYEGALNRKDQSFKIKKTNPVLKAKSLRKKSRTIRALKVRNAKGTVGYKKLSGSKAISVNRKTGKLTVKKGTGKGTYTVKIKITASGNVIFWQKSKKVTVRIRVK